MVLAVGYLNPLFLYGLGALSLPILIHLLFKKRRKRIRFSTLRFLKIATRENARRMRVKQWLLLLVRLAIVALVVLAFARPFLQSEAVTGLGPGAKEVVFLVDRSFSMRAQDELGGTKFARSLSYAAETLDELGTGDRAAVVAFDEAPELVHEMTDDFGAVRAALARVSPGARTTNLAAAIAFAQKLFDKESPRQKVIFLVSDLQVSGLGELADVRLNRGVALEVPDLTRAAANVAVAKLEAVGGFLLTGSPLVVRAQVRNYSTEKRSAVAKLTIGGRAAGEQPVELEAGGTATVEFTHTFDQPGVYGVSLAVEADDALELDDRAYAALDVRRALRVLCVNGTPSQIPYFRETHYLETALNPYRFGREPGTTMFDPHVIEPRDLAAQRLAGCNAVVLANVDYLEPEAVAALEQYVRDGGGLMIFTGDRVSIIQYNRDLYKDGAGLLPARLDPPAGTLLDASAFWEVTNFDREHFIFKLFSDPAAGDLSVPRFYRIHRLGPIEAGAKARALAFFNDGRPMLVEKEFGKGRVLLVPTSADADWNDMPKRKVYLPFVHRAIGYLCGAEMLAPVEASTFVGEPAPLPAGVATVLGPDGRVIEPKDPTTLRETDAPGLYTLRLDDGSERALAVTVNPLESDLRACSVAEFRKMVSGETERAALAGAAGEDLGNRAEVWPYLLMALLAFLLVETWLANRTHV
jgi:hypothetical protein